ncbi:MAG: hypothetical protein LBP53_04635 [Candidatus Peribacteria bacterium]|jgi:hypothetical protein|nr:hypothetical protein [Candidatus Peribacteria bacterium]
MKTLNGAYTGTPDKYPTLTTRNWREIQATAPKEFYYDFTKTDISLVQGFITNLNDKIGESALPMTMYPQGEAEKPDNLTTLDEYGTAVSSTVVSNGKKLKTDISISPGDNQPYLEIDTKKSREKVKDYKYLTFSGPVATTLALNNRNIVKVDATPESNPTQVNFMDITTKQTIGNLKVNYDKDTGYKVETNKNNVDVKASHFYDKLPDAISNGYTTLGISQNDLRTKFDALFKEKFPTGKQSLEGAIFNGKYYKLSVDEKSGITLIESTPPEILEIIQKMKTFLEGMKQVYELPVKYDDGIDKVELNKMAAGTLGSDTFSVEGRKEFNLAGNSFTLTKNILDGDNKKQSIAFTLKGSSISLGTEAKKDQILKLGKGTYDIRYTSKELRVIPQKEKKK